MPKSARKLDGTCIRIKKVRNANKHTTLPEKKYLMFVGLDVHKNSVQVAAVDEIGKLLFNKKISSDFSAISKITSKIPKNAKYVLESSSVWYGLYRHMTDKLHLDVILSNPYNTKIIASSLKKTDKIDAYHLANLLRGGYIAESFVPDHTIVQYRQLVRHRHKIVRIIVKMKNSIHGITLQEGIHIKATPFSSEHIRALGKLESYRIDSYLQSIKFHKKEVAKIDSMIRRMVNDNPDVCILTSISGVGPYTALSIFSEIAEISRFSNSHKLCAYAGIVPSVRNSADTIHHGRITKRGSMTLRWVLTECIHTHAIHAKDSDITKFYNRIKKKRGTSKAAVAGASKILRVIYWMLKERREFVQNYS